MGPVRNGSAQDLWERIEVLVAGHDRRRVADDVWLYLFDPRMPALEHGWKLHVSARPGDFLATLDLLVPVLLRHTCDAKFAVSAEVLRDLNEGVRNPALVGKAVTVYPREQDVVALGRELADVLDGRSGPRVLSDRQVRPGSPVHYRYGPFRSTDDTSTMTGPGGGQTFSGRAGTRYGQPPWATDPFGGADPEQRRTARPVGGRYRLTAGIARSPHGDVYRAVDTVTGDRVVVKQARAYAGEDVHGMDARSRLRNERAVLAALDGLDGVPRVLDHVRHGEDEYLVTTDCGPRDLRRDVLEHGPYHDGGSMMERQIWSLARRLLGILDTVHARGVVVCDLKPGNVVLGADGRCRLVDFGISAVGADRPAGATPGYTLPVYRPGGMPDPADDLYALGATLHHALTGMDPVVVDRDHAVNRERTLACLAAALPGAAHRPARALVAGLLDLDPAGRTACAQRLRDGLPLTTARRLPSPPRVTPGLLDEVIAHTVASCVRGAAELPTAHHAVQSLTLYEGAAGLGLELLHHTDLAGVPDAVAELARRTAAHPGLAALSPALYTGRTGVELFLGAVPQPPGTVRPTAPPGAPSPDGVRDQTGGTAGTGTGALLLAEQARAAGRDEEAARHLAAADACARALLEHDGVPDEDPWGPAARFAAAYDDGFAHGRAGIVHFLHAFHRVTGDPAAGVAARRGLADLAAVTPGLLAAAAAAGATRRFGSWCRGMAGVGTVLVEAGARDGDAELLGLGVRCAEACRELALRMSLVSQCCGLSGVGELFVDLAAATGDDRFLKDAEDVAGLILARSGGTVRRPLLPDNGLAGSSPGWATGSAGVLSFLRRLRDRGGRRPYAPPTGP